VGAPPAFLFCGRRKKISKKEKAGENKDLEEDKNRNLTMRLKIPTIS
jgi:hypothetical protein